MGACQEIEEIKCTDKPCIPPPVVIKGKHYASGAQSRMLASQQGRARCEHCDIHVGSYKCMNKGCEFKHICKKCIAAHPRDHALLFNKDGAS